MEDVSDPPFRSICKSQGADLVYTEFISIESLVRGAVKSRKKLDTFESERPVGIQLFGGDEDSMSMAARIVETVNPDLLDINFGCPVKGIVSRGAGAGVLRDIDRMVRLTDACVKGTRLPVTVKTRLGWDDQTKNIEEVAERLQDTGIRALSIHGRTRCQMYRGEADWTLIGKVKNNPRIHIPIFGNGDIHSPEKALEYRNRYGVDGIMIGRAAIGHPWIFREIRHFMKTGELHKPPTLEERVSACRNHLRKSIDWQGPVAGVHEMRGRYGNYLKGLPGIRDFQKRLVVGKTADELNEMLNEIQTVYHGFEMQPIPLTLTNYHEHCAV
jgi:tRNA-dihydrouridine synthase B